MGTIKLTEGWYWQETGPAFSGQARIFIITESQYIRSLWRPLAPLEALTKTTKTLFPLTGCLNWP